MQHRKCNNSSDEGWNMRHAQGKELGKGGAMFPKKLFPFINEPQNELWFSESERKSKAIPSRVPHGIPNQSVVIGPYLNICYLPLPDTCGILKTSNKVSHYQSQLS